MDQALFLLQLVTAAEGAYSYGDSESFSKMRLQSCSLVLINVM